MKALVYEGVETLIHREFETPHAAPGDHLIRVEAVGICGSDMHAYLGHDSRRPAPLILGHEAAGVIEGGPWQGRRVTVNPLVSCETCPACKSGRENICPERQIISMPPRQGAFAQYITMPAQNLVEVPQDISLDKAALTEPIAVSWHTVRLALDALHPSMERQALVIGGGAIGVAAALALRAMGVEDIVVSEPNAARRAYLAQRCDLSMTDRPKGAPSVVIDAVGITPTRALASEICAPGGVIAHVGLGGGDAGLDTRRMTLQEITFIGTYTYTAQDFRDTAAAIFAGHLGALDWIETRPLAQGAAAFADLHNARVPVPKIVLHPWA